MHRGGKLNDPDNRRTPQCSRYEDLLQKKNETIPPFPIETMTGIRADWMLSVGLEKPVLVENARQTLGLKLPPPTTSFADIAASVGANYPIKVIEVASQHELSDWTLAEYADYLEGCTRAHKVLNLISLEVSDTPLSSSILPPRFVRQVDWSHRYWPDTRRARGDAPKVLKYVLMSAAGAYTDFHVDFGGTSVWYHVIRGAKRFYLIPPTLSNLQKYQQWITSSQQDSTFFGDGMDISYVDITAGDTLLIPSGYIHAVYTPEKSLVVGGNFLVSSSTVKQLQIASIEIHSHIQKKYRYPQFSQMLWYSMCGILAEWKESKEISDIILWQLPYLIVACEYWISCQSEKATEWIHAKEASKALECEAPLDVIKLCWDSVEGVASPAFQQHVAHIRNNRHDVMHAEAYLALKKLVAEGNAESAVLQFYRTIFGDEDSQVSHEEAVDEKDDFGGHAAQQNLDDGLNTAQQTIEVVKEERESDSNYYDSQRDNSKDDAEEKPVVLRINKSQTVAEPVMLKIALPKKNTVRSTTSSGGSMFGTRGKKLTKSFLSNALDVDIEVRDTVSSESGSNEENSDNDDFSISGEEDALPVEEEEEEAPVVKKRRVQTASKPRGGSSGRGRGSAMGNRQKLAKQLGMWR